MIVRRAATADAERLGEIHVSSWKEAYRARGSTRCCSDIPLHRGDNIRLWRDSLPRVLSRLDEHELVPPQLGFQWEQELVLARLHGGVTGYSR